MVMYWCFQWVNRHLMHLVQRILCSSEFRNYDYEAPLKCTTLIKEIRKQTLNLKNKLSNCQMYYSVGSFCYNYHCVSNFCHYFVKGCLFNLEKRLRSMIPLISQLCIISRPIMDHVTGCSSEKTKKYNNDLAKVILDLENILNSPFNKSIHFINDIANNFDFDEQTKYNGFRSTLHVTALCLNHILINLKSLKLEMDPKYIRRIQEFNFVLIQLRSSLYYAEYNFKNHAHITYPESIICQKMVTPNHYVMSQSEKLDQSKFFGYTVGYHVFFVVFFLFSSSIDHLLYILFDFCLWFKVSWLNRLFTIISILMPAF
ncbi:hypothetical protein A3Q56_08155 [Intoshia linei]|uniref:Hormone-sensitive lipase N-terminal domain-containing protein n=1 Tax=Intoshia linei TaxID=1819745 RepID=A0A177ARJ7_9BILA|nr:hypothetical protein A3Q56_08155 [Intoshia linei]